MPRKVRTKSIQDVLLQTENQVSKLIQTCQRAQSSQHHTPHPRRASSLIQSSQQLVEAVNMLSGAARRLAKDRSRDPGSEDLLHGCLAADEASKLLTHATGKCCEASPTGPGQLGQAAVDVLNATRMILLAHDNMEVQNIVHAATEVEERLIPLAKPMSNESAAGAFPYYVSALTDLSNLARKRESDLLNQEHSNIIATALKLLATSLVDLPHQMLKSDSQARRELADLSQRIRRATQALKLAVTGDAEEEEEEEVGRVAEAFRLQQPAANIAVDGSGWETLETQMSSAEDVNSYVDTILADSKAVAEACGGHVRAEISALCEQVEVQRQEFLSHLERVRAAPTDPLTKQRFGEAAENLGHILKKLDTMIGRHAVKVQAPSVPTPHPRNTLDAQIGQPEQLFSPETLVDIQPHVDEFRSHAARLCQVARQAASRWSTTSAAKALLSVTEEVEQLVEMVVAKAVEVHSGEADEDAHVDLAQLREGWTTRVQFMAAAVNELTYQKRFAASAGTTIKGSMDALHQALLGRNSSAITTSAQSIESQVQRLIDIAHHEAGGCEDEELKQSLIEAASKLESVLLRHQQAVRSSQMNPSDERLEQTVAAHGQELLQGADDISRMLHRAQSASTMVQHTPRKRILPTVPSPAEPAKTLREQPTGRQPAAKARASNTKEPSPTPQPPSFSPRKRSTTPRKLPQTPPGSSRRPATAAKPSKRSDSARPHSAQQPAAAAAGVGKSSLRRRVSQAPAGSHVHFSDSAAGGNSSYERELERARNMHHVASSNRLYRQPIYRHVNWVDYLDKSERDRSTLGQVSLVLSAAALRQDPSMEEVQGICQHVREYTDRLVQLAKLSIECFANADNMDEIRLMRTSVSELTRLSPQLQDAAIAVCEEGGLALSSPIQTPKVNMLQVDSKLWAQHVQVISTTIDDFIVPWAATAMKLAKAALTEKGSVDAKCPEIRRLTDHVKTMCNAATEAGQADTSLAFASNQEQREAAEHQRLLDSLCTMLGNLTEELTATAKEAVKSGSVLSAERMHLVCREWGVQACRLAGTVDNVTVGSTHHASNLLAAVQSGDGIDGGVEEIIDFSRTLQDIASNVLSGEGKLDIKDKLKTSSAAVKSLALSLQIVAQDVAKQPEKLVGGQTNDKRFICWEQLEVKSREWCAKVHTATCCVDELTAEVGAPVDRLAGAAVAVSKGLVPEDHVHHIKALRFEVEDILQRAKRIHAGVAELVATTKDRVQGHDMLTCAQRMTEIAPQLLVKAAYGLSSQPDRGAIQQFHHARRCWVAKATRVLALLGTIADVDADLRREISDDIIGLGDDSDEEGGSVQDPHQLDLEEFGNDAISPIPSSKHQHSGSAIADSFSPPRMDQVTSTPHPKVTRFQLADITEDEALDVSAAQDRPPSGSAWLDDSGDQPLTSKSIILAARSLHDEAQKFDEHNNTLARIARNLSQQMYEMATMESGRRRGQIQHQSQSDVIEKARKIASDASDVVRYAQNMAGQTTDKRIREELLDCAEVIPTFSTQLSILASVKSAASSPRDKTADAMLVKNAQNLVKTVMRAMRAAEAACMKGLQEPTMEDTMSVHTREMALLWKRKLKQRRSIEKDIAPIGFRGLRRFGRNPDSSSLLDLSRAD